MEAGCSIKLWKADTIPVVTSAFKKCGDVSDEDMTIQLGFVDAFGTGHVSVMSACTFQRNVCLVSAVAVYGIFVWGSR